MMEGGDYGYKYHDGDTLRITQHYNNFNTNEAMKEIKTAAQDKFGHRLSTDSVNCTNYGGSGPQLLLFVLVVVLTFSLSSCLPATVLPSHRIRISPHTRALATP
jgi:hypothetical protein